LGKLVAGCEWLVIGFGIYPSSRAAVILHLSFLSFFIRHSSFVLQGANLCPLTNPSKPTLIGCGGMARFHLRNMLQQLDTTRITVVCEPSPQEYAATAEVFQQAGQEPPPNQPDLRRLLADYGAQLDTAFIITPHAYHHDQTQACLEAGLDVLLEKPMVMNAAEARSLIEIRDRTRKLLGRSLSPAASHPGSAPRSRSLRSGKIGNIVSINAGVWQDWGPRTVGNLRQQPEIAGGGFLFDTGAHMLNTVADLAGEDFAEVAAWWIIAAGP
jgi:predicted dehydrogenase